MKWFFALNQSANLSYKRLAKVAVYSAKKNTSLEPCCLYDGENDDFTFWLKEQGVKVFFHRTPLYEKIKAISKTKLAIASGALLRCEIPKVLFDQGFNDEYILYTDVDVVFTKDPHRILKSTKPRYFAVAREFDRKPSASNMNSGVMLINTNVFFSVYNDFMTFVSENLRLILTHDLAYDQYLLKEYFKHQWDWLPDEMNWKGHWDSNPESVIIHFHGPKPTEIENIFAKGIENYRLPHFANKAFFQKVLNIWNPAYKQVILETFPLDKTITNSLELHERLIKERIHSLEAFENFKVNKITKSNNHLTKKVSGFNINPYFKQGDTYHSFLVQGWIVSEKLTVKQVQVQYRDKLLSSGQLSESRPDVTKHFPNVKIAEGDRVGFLITMKLSPDFLHENFGGDYAPTIDIKIILEDETYISIAEVEISLGEIQQFMLPKTTD